MSGTNQTSPGGQDFALSLERFALTITTTVSVLLVIWIIQRAGYGYDFSDEGDYLNWIAAPHLYSVSVTQFGFIYHPLYRLVGGNIVLLRQANLLITLGLSWILCFLLLRKVSAGPATADSIQKLPFAGLALILSTGSLVIVRYWMPTPNYNSLTLQALILTGIGMLLADANTSRRSIAGWSLLGLAGWFAFMAKPTTAIVLGPAVGFHLILTRKLRPQMLMISLTIFATLFLVFAVVFDGSIGGFVRRLATGVEDAKILQAHHSLSDALRWDGVILTLPEKCVFLAMTCLVLFATWFSGSDQRAKRLAGVSLTLGFSLVCLAMTTGVLLLNWIPAQFLGVQFLAIPLGAVLATIFSLRRKFPYPFPSDHIVLAITLATFPHLFAFGTDANYWIAAGWASIFWVISGVIILSTSHTIWRVYLPIAAATQACTVAILGLYMEHPYRQTQPLRINNEAMQIADSDSKLLVSQGFAAYVARLRNLATAGGFKVGDPMLDLTGHYPGALFALGARAVGRPWMIGGYPGSEDLAIVTLGRVSHEELAKAWILTEPTGPRKLPLDILKRNGIDAKRDYIEVGTLDSPTGTYPESYKQHLLKPAK